MRIFLDLLNALIRILLATIVVTMIAVVLAILAVGCASVPGPCDQPSEPDRPRSCRTMRIVPGSEFSPADAALIQQGAAEWRRLCFDVAAPEDPPCDEEFRVTVVRDWTLHRQNLLGLAELERGTIRIAGGALGLRLKAVATHETGHFLLGVEGAEHLADGRAGVMQPAVSDGKLTENDREFACARRGHCEWCEP